jgi:response regulator RpfG family c-di-GMP phosphodiesterase
MTDKTQLTILVVDDEASIRQIARRILEREGYQVIEAENGAEERSPLWEGEAFLDKPFTAASLREAVSLLMHGTLKA